ncbi:hypothetical protein EDC04DRAFT_2610779 [Pisolithus marmoratus]|nr:hypothetical protein EDC04DRAFT_2610779 [Pisolithus marmoratus]
MVRCLPATMIMFGGLSTLSMYKHHRSYRITSSTSHTLSISIMSPFLPYIAMIGEEILQTEQARQWKPSSNKYQELTTSESRAQYIAWACPEPTAVVNSQVWKVLFPLELLPYMWQMVNDTDPKNIVHPQFRTFLGLITLKVTSGLFLHECILDTFAHFLETTHTVSNQIKSWKRPVGALALATIAVERMFRQWKTAYYEVPPQKALHKFSYTIWGFASNEVMTAIEKVTEKKWKKIFNGAEDLLVLTNHLLQLRSHVHKWVLCLGGLLVLNKIQSRGDSIQFKACLTYILNFAW